jgi:hypothetical protein
MFVRVVVTVVGALGSRGTSRKGAPLKERPHSSVRLVLHVLVEVIIGFGSSGFALSFAAIPQPHRLLHRLQAVVPQVAQEPQLIRFQVALMLDAPRDPFVRLGHGFGSS